MESAVDGIIVIDSRGRIESFNPGAQRLFGYDEHEVVGRNVSILMPSPFQEEHDSYIARYLNTGQRRIIGIGREVTAKRRDGTVFPVHLSVGEMSIGGERKFTGIVHDLSPRIRIEAQLREQTAMARLGEMAAVIAHEVKNPLAGVRGAIQVLGGRLPADSKDAAIVHEIVSRLDALNELMKDLLLFARPRPPHPVIVDLVALIRNTIELLIPDPAFQAIEVSIVGSAPPLSADPDLLKIVFHNLLTNAAQAIHGSGTIEVTCAALADGCRVCVRDSGPGIPAAALAEVFTPFYTKKARGTGLGLPTAKRIVEAHSGSITVECPADGGTIVTIDLPAGAPG